MSTTKRRSSSRTRIPASQKELKRTSFTTSRSLDYFSRKELVAQVGHSIDQWPIVIVKELVDNAIDGCEETGQAPVVDIIISPEGIAVTDNGLGIAPEAVAGICDFDVRQSS